MAARRGRAPRCTPGRRGRSKRRRAAAPRAGPGPARGPFSPPPPPNPHRAGPGAQRGGTRAVPGTLLRVPSRVSPLPGQARAGLGPGLGPGASGFQRRPFPSWACGAQAVLSPTLLPSTLPRLRGLWLSPPPPHTHTAATAPGLGHPQACAGQQGGHQAGTSSPCPKQQPSTPGPAGTKALKNCTRDMKRSQAQAGRTALPHPTPLQAQHQQPSTILGCFPLISLPPAPLPHKARAMEKLHTPACAAAAPARLSVWTLKQSAVLWEQ